MGDTSKKERPARVGLVPWGGGGERFVRGAGFNVPSIIWRVQKGTRRMRNTGRSLTAGALNVRKGTGRI